MNFYHFRQNNSGGSFIFTEWTTISMVIEAESAEMANKIAEAETSIYFDGCSTGNDCSCCGDRWDEQYIGRNGEEWDKIEVKEEFLEYHIKANGDWLKEEYHDKLPVVIVFHRDGTTDKYFADGTIEQLNFEQSMEARSRRQMEMFS